MNTFFKEAICDSVIVKWLDRALTIDDKEFFLTKFMDFKANKTAKFLNAKIESNQKVREAIASSFFVKIFEVIMQNAWFLTGILMILTFIIPHSRWNNLYVVGGTFLITFAMYINNVLIKERNFKVKKLGLFFIMFMVAVLLAAFISLDYANSIRQLLFYVTAFLSYLNVISSIDTKKDLKGFVYLMFIMAVLVSMYGVYQSYKGIPVNPAYVDVELNQDMAGRAYSTLENPNNFAEFLLLVIPLCGAIILSEKRWIVKIVVAGLTCLPIVTMLLTGTRSAWGALGIAAVVFCFFYNKKLIPLLLIAVLGVYMVLPSVSPGIYKRINTIFNSKGDHSMSYRETIMQATMPILRDNCVSGIGLGSTNFSRYLANNYEFANSAPPHSHNVFVQIWVEVGLLGIISFVLMLIYNVIKDIKSIYVKEDKYIKNILTAIVCSIIAMSIMGFLDYVLFYPRILILFFVFLAIGVSARNVEE